MPAEPDFQTLPAALRAEPETAWARFLAAGGEVPRDGRVLESLPRVWACSRFVAESCTRAPAAFAELENDGALHRPRAPGELTRLLQALAGELTRDSELRAALRRWRRWEMVRIAWRDLAGWSSLEESFAELTELAEASVGTALAFAERQLEERHGVAVTGDGERQRLIVLAMGKLGGRELNFSSDIDLVFLYPQTGETTGRRALSTAEYFTRMGQQLIGLLGATTEDGFVFRVDTRLRPFGESGPLVLHLGALELYLHEHGRDWERYAYVKARPLSGAEADVAELESILRPFVYRRYIDFGVFESLRRMHRLVLREVARRDLRNDLKLGPGGIREIEFIVQSLQLLRGGRDPSLRGTELLPTLEQLAAHRYISAAASRELADAYRLLRQVENRLQAHADRQTHRLPERPDARARLACAMGHTGWPALAGELAQHRRAVSDQFHDIVLGPPPPEEEGGLVGVWEGSLDEEASRAVLRARGVQQPERILKLLAALRGSGLYARLDERSRERLDAVIPRLLSTLQSVRDPRSTLKRVFDIFEAIAQRSAYLALLIENPGALAQLVELCAKSPLISRQVAAHPLLLDELLDPRIFEIPPSRGQFELDLARRFDAIDLADLETQMEALRQFQQAAVFQVVVSDLSGGLPLMKVSDRLTDIAELVLEKVLELARAQLEQRHGVPRSGRRERAGFAVIGYGKLGGIELGYGSDLDIVFLHDSHGEPQRTDGQRALDNAVFFARLATRMLHFLSTQTASGVLYRVDTRLRPSGNAGLLVSSMRAFERYQQEEAWTWEHQALLRARAVAGDRAVREQFERVRREILCRARDPQRLRDDVRDMRARMRQELSRAGAGEFDIKQDAGGLADIEFLVQYCVLRSASQYPALVDYSDNIRQLDGLTAAGELTGEDAKRLADAYRDYRRRLHARALQGRSNVVPEREFRDARGVVSRIWEALLEGT